MSKVAHIGLIVKDIERSCQFYQELCGCKFEEMSYESDLVKIQFLSADGVLIEVLQHLKPDPVENRWRGVVDHIAFLVDDVEAVLAKMRSAGVTVLEGPRLSIIGAMIAFVEGPDGERVEFIQPNERYLL